MKKLTLLLLFTLLWVGAASGQVPNVTPQEAGPDGGLVHLVQFGDTWDGILTAYAGYGVTADQIIQLNGWRYPPQFIFTNDSIVILPPGSLAPSTGAANTGNIPLPTAIPSTSGESEAVPPPDSPNPPPTTQQSGGGISALSAGDIAALTVVEAIPPFLPSRAEDIILQPDTGTEAAPADSPTPEASNNEPPPPQPVITATPVESQSDSASPSAEDAASEESTADVAIAPTPTLSSLEPASQDPTPTAQIDTAEGLATPTPHVEAETPPSATPEGETDSGITLQVVTPQGLEVANLPDLAATTGAVCVTIYDDTNQNGTFDANELPAAGGQITVGDQTQPYNAESELCLSSLPAGAVEASISPPAGFGPTSPRQLTVLVVAGRETKATFGVAEGVVSPIVQGSTSEEVVTAPIPDEIQAARTEVQATTTTPKEDDSLLNSVWRYSAFIALALAICVGVVGTITALLYFKVVR